MTVRTRSCRPRHGALDYLKRPFMADFSSKVRWRMKYDRSPHLVTMQDKFLLREYAAKCNVNMSPLLFVGDKAEDIPFKELPDNCMIKASHGCGWNIIRRNREYFYFGNGSNLEGAESDGKRQDDLRKTLRLDENEVLRLCNSWLRQKYSTHEWAYHQMRPRILIEEILLPKAGKEFFDYRFYTFDGKVAAINVGSPGYRTHKLNVFFRPDWTPLPLICNAEALPVPLPPKPESLPVMIRAAWRLGKGIDFARIDFYETTKGCFLGEMTAYPEGGKGLSPTSCICFNDWLGKQWKLTPTRELHVRLHNILFFVGRRLRRISQAVGH